jgi:hypothetical protein
MDAAPGLRVAVPVRAQPSPPSAFGRVAAAAAARIRLAGYHPAMSRLLLNLRNVPEDEADDVRAFLDANRIAYYETRPSLWGISAGGIWVAEDADIDRAKRLMADYQAARGARARAEYAAAKAAGTAETFRMVLRDHPLRVVLTVLAILALLALVALPVLLLHSP